ncbi:autoimmune regulator isoform X9 [Chroicocephalus ridibundus]|uniref:autoimmune regulator isoform X9 n=1 Tax=Chroicocephalus ridibundus TaxID=1192867 RepID=UPI002FDEAE17
MPCSPGCWAATLLPSATFGTSSSRTTTWSGTAGCGPSAAPSPEVEGGQTWVGSAPQGDASGQGRHLGLAVPVPSPCPLCRGGAGTAAPRQAFLPQPHGAGPAQTPRQEESPRGAGGVPGDAALPVACRQPWAPGEGEDREEAGKQRCPPHPQCWRPPGGGHLSAESGGRGGQRGAHQPWGRRGHPHQTRAGAGEGVPTKLLSASLAGSSRTGSKAGDEPYAPAACEELGARSRSRSLKPPARPKASQSSGEPRVHPQGRLPAPTVHSQDPAPHQENEDECAACGDGGELICCDGCPRAFHLACLVPPLPRVPSGMWRCGSCVASVAEPGRPREVDVAVERPPEVPGEEAYGTRHGGGDGSVCGRCFTRIPAPRHCPVPSRDPGGLLLCMTCAGTLDTGSLEDTAAPSDHPLQAAKAEDGSLGSDPVLSRDELDALLGEVRHSGGGPPTSRVHPQGTCLWCVTHRVIEGCG